jgi:hypothetical protein
MKYQITDNFIDYQEFKKIQEVLLTANFPWYLNSNKVQKNSVVSDLYNFQFTHTFFDEYKIQSNFLYLLDPLLLKINPSAIVRIKANLQTVTDETIVYDMHTDVNDFDGETAIFYINTNNGYTLLKDNNNKIESIENRLLTFPAETMHTGTSCTDQRVRCVINLNYYKWKSLK